MADDSDNYDDILGVGEDPATPSAEAGADDVFLDGAAGVGSPPAEIAEIDADVLFVEDTAGATSNPSRTSTYDESAQDRIAAFWAQHVSRCVGLELPPQAGDSIGSHYPTTCNMSSVIRDAFTE